MSEQGKRAMAENEARADPGAEPLVVGPPGTRKESASPRRERADAKADFVPGADELVDRLRQREEEFVRLMRINERINGGVKLEEILDSLYEEMQEVIPFNRIGFALIDRERSAAVARWCRSDRPTLLHLGYEAPLAGSTLARIIETLRPRIINDLEAYLLEKPSSESTRLILGEGMRSSLTCPLIVQGKPVGFIFFSSTDKGTYSNAHVAFFQQIAGQLATIVEKGRLYSELAEKKAVVEEQNLAMTRDLQMARRVQQTLVPQKAPALRGLEIAFGYEPASQVGGDVLDIVPLDGGRVLFFIGDAMGHGVQAALVMSAVKAALHSAIPSDPRPASVLTRINKVIARLLGDRFVTAACCLIDAAGPAAELALAGHAAPLRYRRQTGDVVQEGAAGLVLGIDENAQYETTSIALGSGDTLVFSTDGLDEAFDPNGNQYGAKRLKNDVLRHGGSSAEELCASIQRNLREHCRGHVMEDDLTLLVVKLADDRTA